MGPNPRGNSRTRRFPCKATLRAAWAAQSRARESWSEAAPLWAGLAAGNPYHQGGSARPDETTRLPLTREASEGNKRATDGTESSRTQTNSNPGLEPNPEPRRAPPNSRRGLRNRRSQVRILSGALQETRCGNADRGLAPRDAAAATSAKLAQRPALEQDLVPVPPSGRSPDSQPAARRPVEAPPCPSGAPGSHVQVVVE